MRERCGEGRGFGGWGRNLKSGRGKRGKVREESRRSSVAHQSALRALLNRREDEGGGEEREWVGEMLDGGNGEL